MRYMKLIKLIFLSTLFSSYMNSFDFKDRNNWDTKGTPKISYEEYIQEIKKLKPLSDSKKGKEKRSFRVKWYTLHGTDGLSNFLGAVCKTPKYGGDSTCYFEERYSSAEAKAILDGILLLDEMKKKYDDINWGTGNGYEFAAVAYHASSGWDYEMTRNERINLANALKSDNLTSNEWNALIEYGIPAAKALKNSKTIDIGFKGQVEVFSQEYNDRIEKRLADIDIESGGLLSLFSDMNYFADYPEKAVEKYKNSAQPSLKTRFEKYCEDIFDDDAIRLGGRLQSSYARKLDFCDWDTINPFITGIYSVDADELKNYDANIYFDAFYIQHFPTSFRVENFEHEFYFGIGPEVLFNAKYGESSGLDFAKKLINLSTEIRNDFYKDVRSREDIKEKALFWGKSSSDPGFKKLISPQSDKEKRIFESFENFIATDEFRQSMLAAETQENINKLLEDQVVKRLIDLKTSMEVIDLCYESRVGYAAVFISLIEYRKLKSKFNENFNKTALELDEEIKRQIDVYGLDLFIENNADIDSSFLAMGFSASSWTPELNEVCTMYKLKLEGFNFFD